jgi:radical SAM superfamily enzyme YgiQ (UPF0313 family)
MKILFKLNKYNQQRQREKSVWIYPVKLAMYATALKMRGHEIYWDSNIVEVDKIIESENQIDIPFQELPIADRILTNAKNKKWQKNGNFKYIPGTYMQVADGCWHGKCTFCVENVSPYVVRSFVDCIKEISDCEKQGYKEIFDDSGTFPTGAWLAEFLKWKITFTPKVVMGCNMRIGADVNFEQMKRANFRMVLFGIESANQTTLNRINKGVNANDIIPTIKRAANAGLEPHIAIMCGFPWENEAQEHKTIELVHYLLRKGYAKTAQASVYKTSFEKGIDRGTTRKIYDVAKYPEFWINKMKDIKNLEDFIYLLKSIKKGILRD